MRCVTSITVDQTDLENGQRFACRMFRADHGFPHRRQSSACSLKATRFGSSPGVILIVVLVVVALLSLAAYTFAELMLTHYRAAQMNGRRLQARMMVESGAEAVRLYLMQEPAAREEAGGHDNNPNYFQAVPVL